MSNMRTHIEFINHSSVIIAASDIRILCDPWFEGDAFHKGWNLIYEIFLRKILSIISEHKWRFQDYYRVLSSFFEKHQGICSGKICN